MPFTEKTLPFLIENRLRNDKAWFLANKSTFEEEVMTPLKELSVLLAPSALAVDEQVITAPKVGKSLSRVYRDTRFSRDKSFFRDSMWVVFMRDRALNFCPPGLVVELSPRGFRCACGYYQTDPKLMAAVRQLIINGDKTYLAVADAFLSQSRYLAEGESFVRVKYKHGDAFAQMLLNKKNLCFLYDCDDFDLLYSKDLYKTIANDFLAFRPYYELFLRAGQFVKENEIHR